MQNPVVPEPWQLGGSWFSGSWVSGSWVSGSWVSGSWVSDSWTRVGHDICGLILRTEGVAVGGGIRRVSHAMSVGGSAARTELITRRGTG